MSNIHAAYKNKCNDPSDINEHLPTLHRYATECPHITEMGVRWIVSTWALLAARPQKMISYDIVNPSNWNVSVEDICRMAYEEKLNYTFIQANVLEVEIEETDLLFIDTLHNYNQLKKELQLHANKVRKYIIFHDTLTYGHRDESNDGSTITGLMPAIFEFLNENPHWYIKEQFVNNNGLTVLARM